MSFLVKLRQLFSSDTPDSSTTKSKPASQAIPKPKSKLAITIGLDFGTAFTKVVIGESRVHYAVPLAEHVQNQNEYLLPCILSIDGSGICHLGKHPAAVHKIDDLKMRILNGDCSRSIQIEIAAFLALVLRRSRAWLQEEHTNVYKDRIPDWFINVGLPTDSFHDKELSNIYSHIIQMAWTSSLSKEPLTLSLIANIEDGGLSSAVDKDLFGNLIEKRIDPEKIGLFPEFVAQITGYVKSPLRSEKLHSLVDIGAGTVDITVFNVWQESGDDLFPIFAKKVEKWGVNYLFEQRQAGCNFDNSWSLEVGEDARNDEDTAKLFSIDGDTLRKIDSPLGKKIQQLFMDELSYTKSKKDPKSEKWKTGVPLFLCGGGARLDFYKNIFNELADPKRKLKVVLKSLPKPNDLDIGKMKEDDYDRLSVAYGLSFSVLDLGTVRTADQVEDFTESASDSGGICPVCAGTGGAMANGCIKCGGSGLIN